MNKLIPDKVFCSVKEITPELLLKEGKKGVIFDIDDTLISHKMTLIPENIIKYISDLKSKGIRIALVSNGRPERVSVISQGLGLFATPKAGKPKKDALKSCLEHLDLPLEQVVFVGDQIFTDILCAKRNHLSGYLVKPIDKYENPFFYIKRVLEKPVLKKYYKRKK
ncbi:MAG: YqeG family HAD IIIA-type phosphatase [Ruminococcaceae bacterium]|nr:YqeG family HAD IIIA-type phosphatase [Oscillospiraceae bacterium]